MSVEVQSFAEEGLESIFFFCFGKLGAVVFNAEQKREWRKANREKHAAYKEQWELANPEKVKAQKERSALRAKEKWRTLHLPRQRRTAEEKRQKKAAWRAAHREQRRVQDQERRQRERAVRLWGYALAGFNIWGKPKPIGYQWVEPEGRIREHTIYALRDPRTQEVRYVGKTVNPNLRLKVHIKTAKRGGRWYRVYHDLW